MWRGGAGTQLSHRFQSSGSSLVGADGTWTIKTVAAPLRGMKRGSARPSKSTTLPDRLGWSFRLAIGIVRFAGRGRRLRLGDVQFLSEEGGVGSLVGRRHTRRCADPFHRSFACNRISARCSSDHISLAIWEGPPVPVEVSWKQ